MLTYAFVLIVYFTTPQGNVETVQGTVKATSLERCNVTRSMTMQALPHTNGWAGKCKPLDPPEAVLPETDE